MVELTERPPAPLDPWLLPMTVATVIVVSVGLVVVLALSPFSVQVAFGALFALLVMTALSYRLQIPVWITLALLFFGNRSEIPLLEFWGRYVATLGVGLFAGSVVIRHLRTGQFVLPRSGAAVITSFGLFLAVLLISAIYNESSLRDLALSAVVNLRYVVFFAALITSGLPITFYRSAENVFLALTFLQVPVTVVQFLFFGLQGDVLHGTMGANLPLIAVTLVSQCILLSRWLTVGRFAHLAGMLVLLLPGLLADINVGLVFLPILGAFVVFRHYGVRRIGRLIGQAILMVTTATIVVFGVAVTVPAVRAFLSAAPEYWDTVTFHPFTVNTSSLGRVLIVPASFPLLSEDPVRLLVGFGPESAQGGLLEGGDQLPRGSAGGSVCRALWAYGLICREPQSFRSMMEFGLMGTGLYVAPMLFLWGRARPLRAQGQLDLGLLFDGVSLLFVVLAFWYASVWRLDSYGFSYWLFAAATFAKADPSTDVDNVPS